jgi:hypothetical protein
LKPNFLFIGPDKSGSTWLAEVLSQHPQAFVAPAKDIYYFDRYYARGSKWYESHFAGADGRLAVGEFSHDYLSSAEACQRIRADLPDARLITMLRQPAERAFSEYLFLRKHGLSPTDAPLRAVSRRHPSIIEGGLYGKHLRPYMEAFGAGAIFMGEFENISRRPRELLAQLCAFLGIDPSFEFALPNGAVLSAAAPRSATIARVAKMTALGMRHAGMSNAVGRIKRSAVLHRFLYRTYGAADRPRLSAEDRRWLNEFYRDDILTLEALVGRSYQRWLGE